MELRASNQPIIIYLQEHVNCKDEKKWLTNKAFFEIGQRLLEDTIKAINEGGFGFHETSNLGTGNIILDTTRKLELGDDIKNLDVSGTILNSDKRVKSKKTTIE